MNPVLPSPPEKRAGEHKGNLRFEVSIEGLRGVAALLVASSHALAVPVLDRGWRPGPPIQFFEAGHAAVLVFFMLSGYVIGLTNAAPFTVGRAKNYLSRRALRLVPVYVVAWCFTLVVSGGLDLTASLGNLLFLQNFDPYFHLRIEPFPMNGPSWSLNYEVVYYLCFMVLWSMRPPLWSHLIAAGFLAIAGWVVPDFPVFLSGYAVGWIFWSLGWWISNQPVASDIKGSQGPVLSGILLLMATHHFASGQVFLNGLGFPGPKPPGMVNLSNLALLPACTLCLIGSARRLVPGWRLIQFTAFAIPVLTLALLVMVGRLGENARWVVAAAFTLIACLTFKVTQPRWLGRLAPFGSISYGFYLIHFPLLFVVQRLPIPSGSAIAFSCRVLLWLLLSIGCAWLLEKQLQPWIRNRWTRCQSSPA